MCVRFIDSLQTSCMIFTNSNLVYNFQLRKYEAYGFLCEGNDKNCLVPLAFPLAHHRYKGIDWIPLNVILRWSWGKWVPRNNV